MKTEKFLVPSYVKKFKCIESLCEDTCCSGWKIDLDKKIYKKYKKISNINAGISFEHIEKNKENPTTLAYGYIKMSNDGNCPYLSKNKLCNIHSTLGETFLSYTCYAYPRIVNKVNGLYEMSGSLSCPEVARIVLLNKEPMEFEDIFLVIERDYFPSITLEDTSSFNKKTDIIYYFWPLRIFTIKTLQDRRYNLDERLILVGLVYKKIIEYYNNKDLSRTISVIENYNIYFNDIEHMKEIIETSKSNRMLSFSESFIRDLVSLKSEISFSDIKYLDIIKKINLGLDIKNSQFNVINEKYNEVYEGYYAPYILKKEYILENYLVNEVFKELYPFAKTESVDYSYKMLLTLYNIAKFHLIGVAAFYKKLDDEIVLNTLQAFSKAILHHKNYLKIFNTE